MKRSILFLLPLLILAGGCAILNPDYIEPADFDVEPPPLQQHPLPGMPVRFGVFRNLSGADRRFLLRDEGNRMRKDEYSRWLMEPETMLERQLRVEFANPEVGTEARFLQLAGTIYRFEFDRVRRMAVLGISYRIRLSESTFSAERDILLEEPWKGKLPEGGVAAMSECMRRSAEMARQFAIATADSLAKK